MSFFGEVSMAPNGWRVTLPATTATSFACLRNLGGWVQGPDWIVPPRESRRLLELSRQFGWTPCEELQRAATAAETSMQASRAVASTLDVLAPPGRSYRPFQRAGIQFILRDGATATLLADDMGLGKTVQALGAINALPEIKRVLIVCPASLKRNWKVEAETWLQGAYQVDVVQGSYWPWPGQVIAGKEIRIINYDLLARHAHRLSEKTWDLLIADEAHYLNSERTQRSRAFSKIQATRRVYLTGTPILNHPRELYPILKSLAPEICPTREEYKRLYEAVADDALMDFHPTGWQFTGLPDDPLAGLQTWLRETVMIRRMKSDVLDELPPKTRQVIELPAEGALGQLVEREHAAQERAEASIRNLSWAVKRARERGDVREFREAVRALRAGRRTAFREMSVIRRETALAKLPLVIPQIEDARRGGKVVVFAHHAEVLDQLQAALGLGVVRLCGKTSPGARAAAVERFQNDPTCTVFLGSLSAAGVGHTLTAASHLIFAEVDWTPSVLQQAEDRIYRIGQRLRVLIQYLVLAGSLDATMIKRTVAKQEVIDRALNPAVA